jgi:phosphohistidine phosphatase
MSRRVDHCASSSLQAARMLDLSAGQIDATKRSENLGSRAMRRLMLFRHAKAERSQPGERDHDRILAARGREDAPKLGAYMVRHGLIPDAVIVSTSARTRETWERAATAFEPAPPATAVERLYDAGPHAILQVVHKTNQQIGTLLVVGHNPGLHELAVMLTAGGDRSARRQLQEGFPTAALAVIDFKQQDWGGLAPASGRLERLVLPRSLGATD